MSHKLKSFMDLSARGYIINENSPDAGSLNKLYTPKYAIVIKNLLHVFVNISLKFN